MTTEPSFITARKAILEDLKRRFLAGDKNVKPLDQKYKYHWILPQDNCYTGAGAITCPVCGKGSLRYSRAEYNGHIHAACTTDGCVGWME